MKKIILLILILVGVGLIYIGSQKESISVEDLVFVTAQESFAADSKVTALVELDAGPEGTDILYIIDDPDVTPISKKITVLNVLAGLELLDWDWTGTNSMGPLTFTSTATPPAADGALRYLSGITGLTSKTFSFYSTEVNYMLSYPVLPTVGGEFPIYNATDDEYVFEPLSGDATMDEDGVVTARAELTEDAIEFVIDGGGSAITTGVHGFLEIPFDCTINAATLLADQSGSIVIDVWVDTYANYPPTDADTITSSTPPTITTAVKSQDTTLTSWTVALSKGDIIGFNVDSVTTCERVTLSLKVDK